MKLIAIVPRRCSCAEVSARRVDVGQCDSSRPHNRLSVLLFFGTHRTMVDASTLENPSWDTSMYKAQVSHLPHIVRQAATDNVHYSPKRRARRCPPLPLLLGRNASTHEAGPRWESAAVMWASSPRVATSLRHRVASGSAGRRLRHDPSLGLPPPPPPPIHHPPTPNP